MVFSLAKSMNSINSSSCRNRSIGFWKMCFQLRTMDAALMFMYSMRSHILTHTDAWLVTVVSLRLSN